MPRTRKENEELTEETEPEAIDAVEPQKGEPEAEAEAPRDGVRSAVMPQPRDRRILLDVRGHARPVCPICHHSFAAEDTVAYRAEQPIDNASHQAKVNGGPYDSMVVLVHEACL